MRRKTLLAFVAIAAIAAIAAGPSAQAHSPKDNPPSPGPWKVVASGLDNPRGIAIAPNGDLWITEAGKGGTAPCFPGHEGGPPSCFGSTGAFTLVQNGLQKRVVTGLPSLADQNTGSNAVGASDIVVNGKHVTGLIGGGGTPADRAGIGSAAALVGWMVKINPSTGAATPFADLMQYEADHNPDKGAVDSNPYGIAQRHGGFLVADAAGNDVLGVNYHKQISTLAVFPDIPVLAPPFIQPPPPSGKIPMQAVPTSVAVRAKDPNVYVGQLTGFPFPPGAAKVFKVAPDGTYSDYATGFTNIVDIAWGPNGSLYVVEIQSAGLLSPDTTGAVIRVWPNGKQTTVASAGLVNPTAVAIARDGTVYVTNYGTSAGKGTVLSLGKV